MNHCDHHGHDCIDIEFWILSQPTLTQWTRVSAGSRCSSYAHFTTYHFALWPWSLRCSVVLRSANCVPWWDRNHRTPALEGSWRHLIAHNCFFVEGHPRFPSKTLLLKKNLAAIKITHFLSSLYFTCRNGVCIKLILWWFYRWDYTPCFLYPTDKFLLKEKKIDGGFGHSRKKIFSF